VGHGVFEQVATVLAICVGAGAIATLLRQPLIVGLLAAGIAVGPGVLGLVEATPEIELLATIGISLLLFVVGLKLDVRLLQRLGGVAMATGLGQVVFTSVLGYGLALLLGFAPVTALYLSLALTFSSTIIIIKLLADKRELNHLYGRIAVGFLIVQDLLVVLAMLVITAIGGDQATSTGTVLSQSLRVGGRGVLLFGATFAVGRFIAPRLTRLFDQQSELLVLAAVTWAIALAAVSVALGFSAEVGAFLAGISLASTPYRDAVAGRLATLRDFLLVFFFIELGTRFDPGSITEQFVPVIVLSLFVLLGNPLVVMGIMGALGYRRRVSFKAGLTVAQISEFSLILLALGVSQGHIDNDVLSLVTVIGLVTFTASTYLINRSDALYARLKRPLWFFERAQITPELERADARIRPEYIVVGVGRLGVTLLEELIERDDRVLGVDFDPRGVKRERWRLPVIYGDADDPDLPQQLPFDDARWIISTVRNVVTNEHLVRNLHSHGYDGAIAVAADDPQECAHLRAVGADVTFRPLSIAASPVVDAIHAHDRTSTRRAGVHGDDSGDGGEP
jgi:Kef-type K+ transport system membrane component KefB